MYYQIYIWIIFAILFFAGIGFLLSNLDKILCHPSGRSWLFPGIGIALIVVSIGFQIAANLSYNKERLYASDYDLDYISTTKNATKVIKKSVNVGDAEYRYIEHYQLFCFNEWYDCTVVDKYSEYTV